VVAAGFVMAVVVAFGLLPNLSAADTARAPTAPSHARTSAARHGRSRSGDHSATGHSRSRKSKSSHAKRKSTARPKTTSKGDASKSHATAAAAQSAVLGTFDISSPAQMSQWKSAGGTAVVIPVIWQAAQPDASGPVSLATAGDDGQDVISEVEAAHADGLAVYLELDLQYPPDWVLSSLPEFVDQDGATWSSTTPGADVRDWVWSEQGREDVSSFVSGALADLAPVAGDVAGIRAGGGVDGELDFPPNDSTGLFNLLPAIGSESYWGYDLSAQLGIGLASGESSTPLPGYVYGTGTAAEDTEWANWYLGSLAAWIKWYVQLLRSDGWSGPIYVLHPSYGMRSDYAPESAAYEQQLAFGTDPATMMDAYDTVSNVWPWCTWADDTGPYYYPGDTTVSDMAPWRYLLLLAQQRGLASHIMGENTGGGGAPAIHQLMSGALASGYTGTFYLDYPYLTTNGLTSYLVSQFDTYAP
jgi:hypothetical protein